MEILEYCDKSVVRLKENYYINLFKPEYNILNNGGLGHSEECLKSSCVYKYSDFTKAKISEAAFLETHLDPNLLKLSLSPNRP